MLLPVYPALAGGQVTDANPLPGGEPVVQVFLDAARSATSRYQDRNQAIRDGYRLLGPDFPSMGEHWIHPGLMIGGRLDPARPQVLNYAPIGAEVRLIGVAYALPLGPDEVPPDFPPGTNLWHDHSGRIDEESVLLNHSLSGDGRPSGHRLVMLHAWIWMDNPAGVFADHNWTLPYLRLGLPPPRHGSIEAAKALSLVTGGDLYYRVLLRAIGAPAAADEIAIAAALDRSRIEVEAWVASVGGQQSPIEGEAIAVLTLIWRALAAELESALAPEVVERLRPVWEAEHVH